MARRVGGDDDAPQQWWRSVVSLLEGLDDDMRSHATHDTLGTARAAAPAEARRSDHSERRDDGADSSGDWATPTPYPTPPPRNVRAPRVPVYTADAYSTWTHSTAARPAASAHGSDLPARGSPPAARPPASGSLARSRSRSPPHEARRASSPTPAAAATHFVSVAPLARHAPAPATPREDADPEARLEAVQRQVRRLTHTMHERSAAITALRATLAEREKRVATLEARLRSASTQQAMVKTLAKRLDERDAALADALERLGRADAERERQLSTARNESGALVTDLRRQLAATKAAMRAEVPVRADDPFDEPALSPGAPRPRSQLEKLWRAERLRNADLQSALTALRARVQQLESEAGGEAGARRGAGSAHARAGAVRADARRAGAEVADELEGAEAGLAAWAQQWQRPQPWEQSRSHSSALQHVSCTQDTAGYGQVASSAQAAPVPQLVLADVPAGGAVHLHPPTALGSGAVPDPVMLVALHTSPAAAAAASSGARGLSQYPQHTTAAAARPRSAIGASESGAGTSRRAGDGGLGADYDARQQVVAQAGRRATARAGGAHQL